MAILVFDTTPLSAFGRAGRLADLPRLAPGDDLVTTSAVLDEIAAAIDRFPRLACVRQQTWLHVERLDGLDELRLFAKYARQLGSGRRDIGEASVLAWAEAHRATVLTDDMTAWQVGSDNGVVVKRTLGLVARAVREQVLEPNDAEALVADLLDAGARFPLRSGQFMSWATDAGLLDP